MFGKLYWPATGDHVFDHWQVSMGVKNLEVVVQVSLFDLAGRGYKINKGSGLVSSSHHRLDLMVSLRLFL
jgi:hypothetical protein